MIRDLFDKILPQMAVKDMTEADQSLITRAIEDIAKSGTLAQIADLLDGATRGIEFYVAEGTPLLDAEKEKVRSVWEHLVGDIDVLRKIWSDVRLRVDRAQYGTEEAVEFHDEFIKELA